MSLPEAAWRDQIVKEAEGWIGTPYRSNAQVKGHGASCATLIYGILFNCDVVPEEKIGNYPDDWFCHVTEDVYTKRLIRLLRYTSAPVEEVVYPKADIKPGTVLLLRCGSQYNNHGGIVLQWPYMVHCVRPAAERINASRHPMWDHKKVLVFDPLMHKLC